MADENIDIRVRLREQRKFSADTKRAATDVRGVGKAADQVDKSARRSERSVGRLRGSFNALGGGARVAIGGVATAVGLYGVSRALGTIYTEGREAIKTTRATEAVLKSTGGAANLTADQVGSLATNLSNKAAIDDEAIQKGLNLLLTFRDIRNEAGKGNDVFAQTASAAVDMSSAMTAAGKNMSVSDAMLQIGKAVNDPEKGMSRLTRVGVTFTKQQENQVKAMTAAGDKLGAQKVIIRELNKEFGGMAGAQADPMQRLGVILNNLAETIGVALIPYLDKAAKWLGTFIMQMQSGEGAGGRFADKVATIWRAYVDWVRFAFNAVGDSISWLKNAWSDASQWVSNAANNVRTAVVSAFNWVRNALNLSGGDVGKLGQAFVNIGKRIFTVLKVVAGVIRFTFLNSALPIIRRVLPAIVQIVRGALRTIGGVVKIFSGIFTGDWRQVWNGVKQVFSGALTALWGLLRGATAPARQAAAAIGSAIKAVFKGAFDWIVDKIEWVIDKIGWAKDQVDSIIPGGGTDSAGAGSTTLGNIDRGNATDYGDRPDAGARPKAMPRAPIAAPKVAAAGPIDLGWGSDTHWQPLVVAIDNVPIARATGKAIRRRQNRS